MDPLLPALVAGVFLVLLVGLVGRRVRLPGVVAYLLAGIALGPSGLRIFEDTETLTRVGDFGVILLLFFAGLEVDLRRLVSGWRVSVIGTLLQILLSVAVVAAIGLAFDWSWARIVLFGFAISLSSTALVLSMLREWGELDTPAGGDALGILLVQDVAVIGMLLVIGFLSGEPIRAGQLGLQALGGVGAVLGLVALAKGKRVRFPLRERLAEDPELQVFAAFATCFGFAWLSSLLGLSTALGAFAAGLIVAASSETEWVHRSLDPLRVLLVSVFFVSVGMLLDLGFLAENWLAVVLVSLAAFVTNTLVNAGILRRLGRSWRTSFYVGALLSQIGEFSFVLVAVGRTTGVIAEYTYQGVLCVIAGTLILGPAWVALWRPFRGPSARIAPPAPE